MTIIVSKGGKDAKRLDLAGITDERYLEQYVAENPESLPLGDIKDDLVLIPLTRQFPTGSGPIDVLATDRDGTLYIIETKLYKNPDKRRVVAQVLDYGAALWLGYEDPEDFLKAIEAHLTERKAGSLDEQLRRTFDLEAGEVSVIREGVKQCLKEGTIQFIVLMDALPPGLKDLILFINEKSKFALYAVEMEFYRHEGYEIVIPRLFGAERKGAVPSAGSWSEKTFFDQAKKSLDTEGVVVLRDLYKFSSNISDDLGWGRGQKASFSPKVYGISRKSLFTVQSTGRIWLNFMWLQDTEAALKFRKEFGNELQTVGFCPIPPNFEERFLPVPFADWKGKCDLLIKCIQNVLSRFEST